MPADNLEFSLLEEDRKHQRQMVDRAVQERIRRILADRERIVEAFIAEFGCKPSEVLQVVEEATGRTTWRVYRRPEQPEGGMVLGPEAAKYLRCAMSWLGRARTQSGSADAMFTCLEQFSEAAGRDGVSFMEYT